MHTFYDGIYQSQRMNPNRRHPEAFCVLSECNISKVATCICQLMIFILCTIQSKTKEVTKHNAVLDVFKKTCAQNMRVRLISVWK